MTAIYRHQIMSAARMQWIMETLGITQTLLASLRGCSQPAISHMLAGRTKIPRDLQVILELLASRKITVDDIRAAILTGDEDEDSHLLNGSHRATRNDPVPNFKEDSDGGR